MLPRELLSLQWAFMLHIWNYKYIKFFINGYICIEIFHFLKFNHHSKFELLLVVEYEITVNLCCHENSNHCSEHLCYIFETIKTFVYKIFQFLKVNHLSKFELLLVIEYELTVNLCCHDNPILCSEHLCFIL
jgi:hypothetical protein